jgi:2-C-methyl-D-erythritol 4-phosphate cytidylyltransferase
VIAEPRTEPAEVHHREHWLGAVLVAAGSSTRMGGIDKVMADLGGKPVVMHGLETLSACPLISAIAVVCSDENAEIIRADSIALRLETDIRFVPGGPRRRDSVLNGVLALPATVEWVVVHDAARPLLTQDLIVAALAGASETGAAVCAVPVTDTIKRVDGDNHVVETPERDGLVAVQTPQVFRATLLLEAHRQSEEDATDDAALVERLGVIVKVVSGHPENLKITRPFDLAIAEAILALRASEE